MNTGADPGSVKLTSHYTTCNQEWWMGQPLCTSWELLMVEECQSVAPKSSERSCQIWRLHYYCWPLSSLCHYLSAAPPGRHIRQSEWKWWLIIVYDKQTILTQVFLITYAVITLRHNGRKRWCESTALTDDRVLYNSSRSNADIYHIFCGVGFYMLNLWCYIILHVWHWTWYINCNAWL